MTHTPLRRTCCKDFNNVCIISEPGGGGGGGGSSQENPVLKTSRHLYKTVCLAYVEAKGRVRVLNSILFPHAFRIISHKKLFLSRLFPRTQGIQFYTNVVMFSKRDFLG